MMVVRPEIFIPPDHLLSHSAESYRRSFIAAAANVYARKDTAGVLQHKFRIPDTAGLDIANYVQSAAELTVQNHLFHARGVTALEFDKKVHPPKDVEAYFHVNGTHISLEVKCAVEEAPPPNNFVFQTAGRIPNHQRLLGGVRDALRATDGCPDITIQQNKDNTMGGFLTGAHEKFSPASSVGDLNILFVACGDAGNMNSWYGYLAGDGGLFTPHSFIDPIKFELVDVVILSNLKYFHQRGQQWHDWTLRDVLMLPVLNPKGRKSRIGSSIIKGLGAFDHQLRRFGSYAKNVGPNFPSNIGHALKVMYFVMEELTHEERTRYFPATQWSAAVGSNP